MHKWLLLAAAAILPYTAFAVEGDFHWTGKLNPGQTLEIKGVNGSIQADLAPGTDVRVDARKSAKRSDINSVQVQVVPNSNGVTICSVYPSDGGRANECKPGNEGHMSTRDNDVRVDYTVHIPKGVRFVPKTVNGDLVLNNLQSDLQASTVNGKIRLSTSQTASAHTVNGSIDASVGSSWTDRLEFTTVNGSINVTMPAGVNTDVQASVVNGGISTDFPLTVSGRWGPKSMKGRIGSGGPELKLSTVNGGIELHSSSGRAL